LIKKSLIWFPTRRSLDHQNLTGDLTEYLEDYANENSLLRLDGEQALESILSIARSGSTVLDVASDWRRDPRRFLLFGTSLVYLL
jgi:hypothetical protein